MRLIKENTSFLTSVLMNRILPSVVVLLFCSILFLYAKSLPHPPNPDASVLQQEIQADLEPQANAETQANSESQINPQPKTMVDGEVHTPVHLYSYESPYQEYFDANSDMIAWIKIEDTLIDYPVMQTPEDEEYYLLRDFNGNADKNGCLFIDTNCEVGKMSADGESYRVSPSTNIIVYGHHMKSGAMFGKLEKYKKKKYAEEHSVIQMFYQEEERDYEVMAAFYSQLYSANDTGFHYYEFFYAFCEEDLDYFLDGIEELQLYDTGVTTGFGDEFLTLSTCSYQVENGRFVVVAKRIH